MKSLFSTQLHVLFAADACTSCGLCSAVCTTRKITASNDQSPVIRANVPCISCGHCIAVCPAGALSTDTPGFVVPEQRATDSDADQLAQYLQSRRSVRIWKDMAVSRKDLQKLIDVAAYAPSACNIHPVKWVIIADPGKVREFSRAAVAFLKTLPQDHPVAGVAGMLIAEAGVGNDPICRNAPAVLIAATDSPQDFGLIDSVIALSSIDVYAPSLGIGTCWVGYVMIMLQIHPELGKILGIPDGWTPQYAMLAGYPGMSFSRTPPREIPEIVWG